MICPSRPLELRQSIEDMEQEFALRRGGVHLLGQRNVPPRVFRYRRAPLPPSRRRRSRRNSVASAQPRSRSVRLCYKNGPFVSSGLEAGLKPSPRIRFVPYDCLRKLGRGTSGRHY